MKVKLRTETLLREALTAVVHRALTENLTSGFDLQVEEVRDAVMDLLEVVESDDEGFEDRDGSDREYSW